MIIRRTYKTLALAVFSISVLGLSGCQTVSEDVCLAGNWEAIGFKDGANGKSENRLGKIVEGCAKYGSSVDNQAYWAGYEAGLTKYCTFQRGYSRGESGGSYNQVCSGDLAMDYAPGYEEGHAIYEIHREHKRLISRYEDRAGAFYDVRTRLQNPDLEDEERRRLKKKARRLEHEMDNLRYNIRQFERRHGLHKVQLNRGY